MSTSTNAYLFFGIELNEMEEEYGLRLSLSPEICLEEDVADLDIYDELHKLTKGSGVDFDSHGYHEFPAYFIYSEMFSASRGFPTDILSLPEQTTVTINKLKELALSCNITTEPKWVLASYWG